VARGEWAGLIGRAAAECAAVVDAGAERITQDHTAQIRFLEGT
jgi:hypothetical protein